jgi:poly(A) polymerase
MLGWLKSLTKKPKSRPHVKKKRARKKRASNQKVRTASHTAKNKAVILSRGEHGISRNHIDSNALKVLYRLHKEGYQACLVGGAVRDLLLGLKPKDFDVATDATPDEVNKLFRNCRLIGRRFRLAHVHFGRQIIEVATYRANHDLSQSGVQDESGRIVRDNVFGGLADDVWRRDFTANALYYDISNFSVIDFVGGYKDIKRQRLCLIGDVETRYREDPVRMLRALRFSAKLGFEIEEKSKTPIYSLGHLLADIPAARLYEEVLKLFHSGHAVRSFELLLEFDVLKYLFPEAAKSIEQDEAVKQMLIIAMKNTDDRIQKDMRVTPAFLFAALLWHPVNSKVHELMEKGMPYSVAIQKVATRVLSQQASSVSIPKRFTSMMRDIWGLQTRFHYRAGKRAMAVLEHEKFRAGYDFLCIRVKAGEVSADQDLKRDCEWWTDIQKQTAEQQKNALFSQARKPGKKKRSGQSAKKKKAKKSDS